MKCNICGCSEFISFNKRENVRCKNCNSLERTRLLWLYIEKMRLAPVSKVLHVAPELGIYRRLSSLLSPGNYTGADYNPSIYPHVENCQKIDLASMEAWPSNSYDLIVHVHVLEHIPCNIAYSLFHLHRMLKPTGKHLFIVPFSAGVYDECFDPISDDERTRRFGQTDHVRKFGWDNLDSHLGKILNLPKQYDATADFSEAELVEYNIPKSHWRGFQPGTVMCLNKHDYKLTFD